MWNHQEGFEITGKLMRLEHLMRMEKMRTMGSEGWLNMARGRGRILVVLNMAGPISPGDLAFILQIRQQSMNETLKKLEDAGLIQRRQDESDKRKIRISLTEAGKAAVPRIPGNPDAIFDCLTQEEKTAFAVYLDRISAALAEQLGLPEQEEEQLQAMRERMSEDRFRMMMDMRKNMGMAHPGCDGTPPCSED